MYHENGQGYKLLTEADGNRIARQVVDHITREGALQISIVSYWRGELSWARNRALLSSDRRNVIVGIIRMIGKNPESRISVYTNQIDPASIRGATQFAERLAHERRGVGSSDMPLEKAYDTWPLQGGNVWSESTYNRSPEENLIGVNKHVIAAEENGLMSAGYLESNAMNIYKYSRDLQHREFAKFDQVSQAQCSATVRSPKGTGSGWAGMSSYDFSRIEEEDIMKAAMDKCIASIDTVRIEPGKYTVILEPQATFDIVKSLWGIDRASVEERQGEYTLGFDSLLHRFRSKLGLKIVDSRVTISHNPMDPDIGTLATPTVGPVKSIENGVLVNLFYDFTYGIKELYEESAVAMRRSFEMDGGKSSMQELVESSERALLVTRFYNVTGIPSAGLLTGVTRDGLWLIERGRITKAVRNFKFTESPLFALNNLVDLGPQQVIWNPVRNPSVIISHPENSIASAKVPFIKVRDFSFTSTIDAI